MLEIARGRHVKPQKIPLEQRTCQRCTINSVDDEIHFLITCSYFATQRTSLLAESKLLNSEFDSLSTQRTRDIDPMLDRCWASVLDGGTTLASNGSMSRVCWETTTDLYILGPMSSTLRPLVICLAKYTYGCFQTLSVSRTSAL